MRRVTQLRGLCVAFSDTRVKREKGVLTPFLSELDAECDSLLPSSQAEDGTNNIASAVPLEVAYVSPKYNNDIPEPASLSMQAFQKSWYDTKGGVIYPLTDNCGLLFASTGQM